jgi:hypothetical protein
MSLTKLNFQPLIGKQIFADGWVRDNSGIILDGRIESIVEKAGYRNRLHYIVKTENSDKERKLEWIIVKALIEKGRWDANKFENSGTNARIIENPEKELYSSPDETTKDEPQKEEINQDLKNQEMATDKKTAFEVLSSINVNDAVKQKPNASKAKYLPWSNAWAETKKRFPAATWRVVDSFSGNDSGLSMPYCSTPLGIMVKTEVTIDGVRQECQLPVLNSKNQSLKDVPYTLKGKYGDQVVKAATMFDVNTTIMRCLTKNLALFGLGLYIYTDDTMPEDVEVEKKPNATRPKLTIDHALYPAVEKYVKDNAKKKDWELIMKQLKTKYTISDTKVLNQLTMKYNESK